MLRHGHRAANKVDAATESIMPPMAIRECASTNLETSFAIPRDLRRVGDGSPERSFVAMKRPGGRCDGAHWKVLVPMVGCREGEPDPGPGIINADRPVSEGHGVRRLVVLSASCASHIGWRLRLDVGTAAIATAARGVGNSSRTKR